METRKKKNLDLPRDKPEGPQQDCWWGQLSRKNSFNGKLNTDTRLRAEKLLTRPETRIWSWAEPLGVHPTGYVRT